MPGESLSYISPFSLNLYVNNIDEYDYQTLENIRMGQPSFSMGQEVIYVLSDQIVPLPEITYIPDAVSVANENTNIKISIPNSSASFHNQNGNHNCAFMMAFH